MLFLAISFGVADYKKQTLKRKAEPIDSALVLGLKEAELHDGIKFLLYRLS